MQCNVVQVAKEMLPGVPGNIHEAPFLSPEVSLPAFTNPAAMCWLLDWLTDDKGGPCTCVLLSLCSASASAFQHAVQA